MLDRGQQKIWGLNQDWIRVCSWSLAQVTDACFLDATRWWLAQKVEGTQGAARLLWVRAGELQSEYSVSAVLGLTPGSVVDSCWALTQPTPGRERILECLPGLGPREIFAVPGAEQLLAHPQGVWALHSQGAVWWVPFENPSAARMWVLPAGVRLARSVGSHLWIRLDSKGGPWCRVHAGFGPSPPSRFPWAPTGVLLGEERQSPVARAWLEAQHIEPLFAASVRWGSAGRGAASSSTGERAGGRIPQGTAHASRPSSGEHGFERARPEDSDAGVPESGAEGSLYPRSDADWGEPDREGLTLVGWALLAPEFVWQLDPQGSPLRGQGGFALLRSGFWRTEPPP